LLTEQLPRAEIETMLNHAGFVRVIFSEQEPFWCAVSIKAGHNQMRA
jgi:hypothetical protein